MPQKLCMLENVQMVRIGSIKTTFVMKAVLLLQRNVIDNNTK